MHHLDLILTLTGGLAAALVFGYLTHRLGLSPIVGYLVGGIAALLPISLRESQLSIAYCHP